MSSSDQQITRCPKCGTAFRITRAQLQSAKGAVRCGSCLNVFKALDYLVKPPAAKTASTTALSSSQKETPETAATPAPSQPLVKPASTPTAAATKPHAASALPEQPVAPASGKAPEQLAILSSIKPLPVNPAPVVAPPVTPPAPLPTPTNPVVRVLDKSSLDQVDDILISDDMEEAKPEVKSYEFDGFLDIDVKRKADVSLFERKIREQDDDKELQSADESWAEMLIEDDEDTPSYKTKRDPVIQSDEEDFYATEQREQPAPAPAPDEKVTQVPASPSLVFSLVGEEELGANTETERKKPSADTADDLVLSDELATIPDHTGFKPPPPRADDGLDPGIFEMPDSAAEESAKRQVKTQPKIRSYDGSRTALLMNIIPAPIEFTAKRMRRWYQRKLWPALSLLALVALVSQLAWFKFDYFSRVEPYRTAYTFLCPYLGCQVPTLVDTRQINAFNLVVREHPETAGALAVDVMIMNNAPFDQPYPDLVLMFTDLDETEVASRRFSPREYLGGEAAGSNLMPQKQPVHLTLDLVDPGERAVNYHIYIPQK